MNVFTRGVRNAFRNSIRTFSIIVILGLSIALALAMVLARGAVEKKIESVKGSIGNTVTVTPAGVRGFEGGGEPLTTDQIAQVKTLAHVSSAAETLNDRLDTSKTNLVSAIDEGSLGKRFQQNNGESVTPLAGDGAGVERFGSPQFRTSFTPPISISGTDDLQDSNAANNGSLNVTSGSAFDVNSTDNVALVGKTLADKNSLSVGSTFTAYGAQVKVVGIFDAGNTFSNNQVLVPIKTLQTLSQQANQVSSAVVKVDSISNVDGVVKAIQGKLGSAADVVSQESEAQSAIAPLENIKTISLFSLIGAVAAGSAIILLTMVMIVRERRREIGVLKAIGASNLKVMVQFMSEAVTFTLLAAVVGILLGVVGGQPITKVLVNNSANSGAPTVQMNGVASSGGVRFARGGGAPARLGRNLGLTGQNLRDVRAVVGWSTLVYGLGAALLIAVIGSSFAALLIAKIRPAEVMRVE